VPPSGRDHAGKALEALAAALGPFVDREMTARSEWGAQWRHREEDQGRSANLRDPQVLLGLMAANWQGVFRQTLGQTERSLVSELREWRNRWAHHEKFTVDDTYRCLDSVERLLQAISAGEAAAAVRRTKHGILIAQVDRQRAASAKRSDASATAEVEGLAPWREVVTPHPDVQRGTYQQAEFAADLAQVLRGEGSDEYRDPVEFFRRTYLTQGLRELLTQGLSRVAGGSGAPVVDLQTNFGGGKTHSLLALYHLLSGTPLASFPPEVRELVAAVAPNGLPAVRRAVLVGTNISPGEEHKRDGITVRTLWGELAWQLGGRDGYEIVRRSDETRTNPGEALERLFREFGPCLVLIDEWVAYARQLFGRDDLPGGSFDTHFTFAQKITEATKAVPGTLLVVSLPASSDGGDEGSAIEVGGVGGREALARLRNVIGRTEFSWRPASAEEGFEIVRRRLFEPIPEALLARRDDTTARLADQYRRAPADYPSDCREPSYRQRIERAYPIHPELFDRLYEDWSTLERFQRTRGVLRLMAAVVHALWSSNDRAPLILPASIPLDDPRVAGELTRHLDDTASWPPVIDADIDGERSLPAVLDGENQAFGRYSAARRAARTVFLGSAATLASPNKGLEAARMRLGCVLPAEQTATFDNAIARLAERATYLHAEGGRYWFGTQQNINRRARDEAERLVATRRDELHAEICRRLRDEKDRGELAGVHRAPDGSGDVADEPEARLVVLGIGHAHTPGSETSPALDAAREIFERRGSAQRIYRNMLVFLAADQRRVEDLEHATAEYMAWQGIVGSMTELNLDPQQQRQARERLTSADQTVDLRLSDAYRFLLIPTQPRDASAPPAFPKPITVEGSGTLAARVSKKLLAEGALYTQYSPSLVRALWLEGRLKGLWEPGHVSVAELWDAAARYVYLPRLRDRHVLEATAAEGPAQLTWQTDGWATADGYDAGSGRYLGLVVNGRPPGTGGGTLLVKPEVALTQLEKPDGTAEPPGPGGEAGGTGNDNESDGKGGGTVERVPTRFYATFRVDPERPSKSFGDAWTEVAHHLRDLSREFRVTVEIEATGDGYDDATVRTVNENARTLKFDQFGFEES
jgi:predicted AAA+ superfamily ATPase